VSSAEDPAAIVTHYLNEGVRLVRLKASDRQPLDAAWQDPNVVDNPRKVLEDHVRRGGGIGWQLGEVSGGLAVVDADWKLAVKMAPRFLPETLRGAKGSEGPSHYAYNSPGLGYGQFNGLDGSRIIDLKASNNGRGHFVAVEPTEHPKKGSYHFVGGYNPAAIAYVEPDDLKHRIRLLAVASLIAANLPGSRDEGVGGRHDLALALIGYLLRNGVLAEEVERLLVAAWEIREAPREALEDIRRSIPDTAQRLSRDEPVKGGHKLEEAVPGMPRRVAEFLGWSSWDMEEKRKSYMRTDLGNAERFVDTYSQDVRWCTEANRWMLWDGSRWGWDEGSHATHRLAHKSVRSIFKEAENAPDNQEAKAISAHAVASQAASRIEAMLSQARPYLNISMDALDRDTWLVNARNGTLDLRTGDLREHDREDLITKSVPFDYDPEAAPPRFEEFLRQVLPDPEVRAFVQRYAGYSLTGSTRERVLAFLHGGGKNGKSTLVEALREAAGEYAQNTTVETILSSRGGSQIPNDVAALKGARLVSAAEPEKNRRMAESKVKNLTGSDTVTARFMRGEFFDFKPEFKLWISMNHKPIIIGTDDAIWDRIRLVPFGQRFEGANRDPKLPDKLKQELPGIFAWMVRGALDWQENGLGCPEAVAAATKEYREEMDSLGDFLEARCVVEPNATVTAAILYTQYGMWCEDTGERKETQTAFGARLSERGFESFKFTSGPNKDRKGWRGIGIKADSSGPEDGPPSPESSESRADRGSQTSQNGVGADSYSSSVNKGFAGETPSVEDRADSSGPKNSINRPNHSHEAVMPKMGPQPSALSAPASFNATSEDGAISLEELNQRRELGETSPVAELFTNPPDWLKNQATIYRRNPTERMLKPLCAAIAHELGADAGEIRPEVERELGSPA
jgi:P4 family phage/plasmid primase-like protien